MELENLLPIGSIVRLKDSEKRMMVFGIAQTGATDEGEVTADYIGVPYPEGNMGIQYQYLFDHEDIDEIVYRGFEDDARDAFLEQLAQVFRSRSAAEQ